MAEKSLRFKVGDRVEIDEQAPFGAGKGVITDYGIFVDYHVHRDDNATGGTHGQTYVAYHERELRAG